MLFKSFIHGEGECSSYFIEPPVWLKEDEVENEQKFYCPKCKVKIGEALFSGRKCSCSKWVTPGIQVHKNKVDRIVQNL